MPTFSKTSLVITALAIIAIGWFVYTHRTTQPTPIDTTSQQQGTWPSAQVTSETISDSTSAYTINATYPVAGDDRITAQFKQFVDDQIEQFKKDTAWATDPSVASAEAQALTLDISYREERATHVDNYIFTIVTYTGGAHGLQATQTFSFDQNGKLLNLDDIFTDKQAGLKALSLYATKELTTRAISDANWVAEGAGPTIENYQNIVLTDVGITAIFDPYQVAAYSAGTQTVQIPFSAFASIANKALFVK